MKPLSVSIHELFADATPALRHSEITWNGKTSTVYFQRLSFGDTADLLQTFLNADGRLEKEAAKQYRAALIAATVRDENGATFLTAEQVMGKDNAFVELLNAEVSKHVPTTDTALEEAAKNSVQTPANSSS